MGIGHRQLGGAIDSDIGKSRHLDRVDEAIQSLAGVTLVQK
jgi:hypothetical protein